MDDIARARLMWKSEWLPGVYGAIIQSGNSGLIVADGKVYLIYQWPNDEVYDETYARQMTAAKAWGTRGAYMLEPGYAAAANDPALREAFARRKFAIAADDVVLCLEAQTGKTAWKAVFERKGINPTKQGRGAFICAKCAPHSTPCHYRNRLYAIGSTGRLYCVDAGTGEPLWESDLGETFRRLEAAKEQARRERSLPGYGRMDLSTGPVHAEGVIVVYDDASSLVGFDPDTGRKLWTTKGPFSNYHSSPVRWPYRDREYVVVFGSKGTCIDPRDGRILWQVDVPPARESGTATVGGDYAVFGTTCYRISPAQAEKVWDYATSAKKDGMVFITPMVMDGCVYFCHGQFGVVEAATGKVLGRSAPAFTSIGSSVVGGDGRAFKELGRDEGSQILMAVAPRGEGAIRTSVLKVPHYAMSTTPVYLNGRLYLRMQDHVACYDLAEATALAADAVPASDLTRQQAGTSGTSVTEGASEAARTPSGPAYRPPAAGEAVPDVDLLAD